MHSGYGFKKCVHISAKYTRFSLLHIVAKIFMVYSKQT